MNEHTTPHNDSSADHSSKDRGFTLVEILIAIVLVGILSAVVVVGISNLTSKGSQSACVASLDAAKAGSVVYFASNDNTYPVDFTELTADNGDGAALELPAGVKLSDDAMSAKAGSWTLSMTSPKSGKPTFACS